MGRPVPILMYHELLADGASPARPGEGYARYVIGEDTFREQLRVLQNAGARGIALDECRSAGDTAATGGPGSDDRRVVITFDDGCASDRLTAAPILKETGFGATFFVTVGHLGTPGFMTRAQVRELADAGFAVGSHGMTHAYMSDLDEAGIRAELSRSKTELEDMTGRTVSHFSCPGGRWSRQVASIAMECGYTAVCDSRPVGNAEGADPFRLGRFAITKATTATDIERIARDGSLGPQRFRSFALAAARAVLGNRMYDRARSVLLERGSGEAGI